MIRSYVGTEGNGLGEAVNVLLDSLGGDFQGTSVL